MIFLDVDMAYLTLCRRLLTAPKCGNTRELNNVKIEIKDITQNVVSIRDISPSYLFGELLWYFNGSQSLDYISKFSSFWEKLSDDGITSNSAYGHILMYRHGFNQIDKIVELLRKDPQSRRAVLNINVPNENVIETKDEPCTIAIQYLIRDEKLHCTVIMRSNDIWFGTPYDWAFFMELQKVVADKLKLSYGTYTHFATSLHVYDRDYDKIAQIVRKPKSNPVDYSHRKFQQWSSIIYKVTKWQPDRASAEKTLMKHINMLNVWKGKTNAH